MNSSHDSDRKPSRPGSIVGVGLVLAAALLFGVNGSVSKLVMASGLGSLHLVEIRCLAAAAVFFLLAALRNPGSLAIGRRELGFVAVFGVVGVAMVQWLYFAAITRMPVSISLLIEFTAPVLVALWVRFVRRQPVRSRIWVALLLVLAGLALVAQVWAGLTLDGLGLLLSVLAAGALATYYLLGESGLTNRDPLSLAAWSFAAAAVFWALLLPWWSYPFERLTTPVAVTDGIEVSAGVLVIWVVLLGTVAPFGLVLAGLSRIGATRTGLVGTAEPPLAGIVAWLMLDERLTLVQIGGAGVVLAGIILAETSRAPGPADDRTGGQAMRVPLGSVRTGARNRRTAATRKPAPRARSAASGADTFPQLQHRNRPDARNRSVPGGMLARVAGSAFPGVRTSSSAPRAGRRPPRPR